MANQTREQKDTVAMIAAGYERNAKAKEIAAKAEAFDKQRERDIAAKTAEIERERYDAEIAKEARKRVDGRA